MRTEVLNIKDTINPLQLFTEKRQFFNQNNEWLNNIIYHKIAILLLFWMAQFVFLYDFAIIHY